MRTLIDRVVNIALLVFALAIAVVVMVILTMIFLDDFVLCKIGIVRRESVLEMLLRDSHVGV